MAKQRSLLRLVWEVLKGASGVLGIASAAIGIWDVGDQHGWWVVPDMVAPWVQGFGRLLADSAVYAVCMIPGGIAGELLVRKATRRMHTGKLLYSFVLWPVALLAAVGTTGSKIPNPFGTGYDWLTVGKYHWLFLVGFTMSFLFSIGINLVSMRIQRSLFGR